MTNITEQESFWKGEFGNEYTDRNKGAHWLAANMAFFSHSLAKTDRLSSVLELGANTGLNLAALNTLLPQTQLSAVEINEKAAKQLQQSLPAVDVNLSSILDFKTSKRWDLVFTKGVLIHINPEKLDTVYELMYQASSRYILIAEYYNPSPVGISYRGHSDKLFKRDFAGEMLDKYPNLQLLDYGFSYHRDTKFPQDDLNWFLLEKR